MHIASGSNTDSTPFPCTPPRTASQSSATNAAVVSSRSKSSVTQTMEQDAPFVLHYGEDECKVGKRNDDLTFSVVWSPLPPITWFLPFIGHTGICDSSGVASDFQGPYLVGDDGRMAFGAPTRAVRIEGIPASVWDDAIQEANTEYRGRVHNIFCDNCHSHVAYALNKMAMNGSSGQKWNMVKICSIMFFRGRFLSFGGFLLQVIPFSLVVLLFVWMKS